MFKILAFLFMPVVVLGQQYSGVSSLEVSGSLKVRIDTAAVCNVVLPQNSNEPVTVEQKGEKLIIKTPTIRVNNPEEIVVSYSGFAFIEASLNAKIYSSDTLVNLRKIEAGSGTSLDFFLKSDSISCSLSKGAFLRLSGNASSFNLELNTGSDFRGEEFLSEAVYGNIKMGTANLYAKDVLIMNVGMGGVLQYSGNPNKVDVKKTINGKVEHVEESN